MWKRRILDPQATKTVTGALQRVLVDLIDLGLIGKQAHWNVFGKEFLPVHEKLDEVVATARAGSDEVAERMDQLGVAPDGRVNTVAETSRLAGYPDGFVDVQRTLGHVCDALQTTIQGVREARAEVADPDPITEDLLIGILHPLETQLWMLQAVEGQDPNK
jgi:starvation-inducible DNA-binding protein